MEKMWHYTRGDSEQQGPVSESEIRGMLASGALSSSDLVWAEGMAEWVMVSSVPVLGGGTEVGELQPLAGMELPPRLLGWMTFIGVMCLLSGILQCLSCVGIITGVFMIIAGSGLLAAKGALASVSEFDSRLALFFEKLNTFMSMLGVTCIIGIVLYGIVAVVYFGIIMTAVASAY